MSYLNVEFDSYDMILSILISDKEEKRYDIQLEYSFIDEKKVVDDETHGISEQYIFAYSLNESGVHKLNGKPFSLSTMEESHILSILKTMLIVNSEIERELLKSEFKQFFYLLSDNVEADFNDCLSFCDIY